VRPPPPSGSKWRELRPRTPFSNSLNVASVPAPTSPISVKRPVHRQSTTQDAQAPMRRELVCRSEGVGATPVAPLPVLRREESLSDPSAAERTWA
jgi:hypothetical protein